MVLTSAPLEGLVGLELDFSGLFAVKAEAATSSTYLTSGFCGDTSDGSDGKNISWTLDENGVLTVTGTGKMAKEAFKYDQRIKEAVIGDGITNISEYCFNDCRNLTKVTMGDDVESIDSYGFYDLSSLKEIEFSSSLKTIGNYAFEECYSLTTVNFPDSLESIGKSAFESCLDLVTIEFPDSLESISDYAFHWCTKLKNIQWPTSLKSIGISAFYHCSVETIMFPNNLESIANSAFSSCEKLTTILFPNSLKSIDHSVFCDCKSLKAINLSDSLENLGDTVFTGCSSLETVYFGKNLKTIPANMFGNCGKLSSVNVSEENLSYSSCDGILYNKEQTEIILVPDAISGEVTIPASVKQLSQTSVDDCPNLTDLNVEDGNKNYKSIDGIVYSANGKNLIVCPRGKTGSVSVAYGTEIVGYRAFHACDDITDVTFPNSLKSIYSEAFSSCKKLKTINFSNSLEYIDHGAFEFCYCLTTIELPDSLKKLGSLAFWSCGNIETVSIGKNLNDIYINTDVFKDCDSLTTITVSEENPNYSSYDGVLYNKDKTKIILVPYAKSGEITIPATVENLTYIKFVSCPKITAINIESESKNYKSVDGIVYSADGKNLIVCPRGKSGSVTIVDGTESIGECAFQGCSKLTLVDFCTSLKSIDECAFRCCAGLTMVELPDSLESIGTAAFAENTELRTVEFDDSLKAIGEEAFYGCSKLTTVNIPKCLLKIDNDIFYNCGFTDLTLPTHIQSFDKQNWSKLKTLTIENRYCEYTSKNSPGFASDCTIRAYCGSPGHELAVKSLYNFESIGHTFLDWYVKEPATYEKDGIERRDCAYCDGYEERVIPKLVKDTYTATFVADGKVVSTVDFSKGATEISEPTVPAKDRYIGEWEDYTLADSDITVNAVYTLIKSSDASQIKTDSEVVHYTDKDDVLFRFKAWADAKVVKSTVSKSVPLDIVLVVDQSGSMDETLGGRTKKVDALKNTANEFIQSVFENAKLTGADHRISLVGFGLSGDYQGYEKNENTELLTSANGAVRFDKIKTTDYATSLLNVNVNGEVNEKLTAAVGSIAARGATAADLGFEMAKGVFANTDSTDRQRVVIFMTDGEPTYSSDFQTSVANSAIANASLLKKAYNASVYSVGIFSQRDSQNSNIRNFMNAVSSGYPDAVSMKYMGSGVDGQFYLNVNNTDALSSVFKSISTESLSHTAPFDNLTVIKTLSKYVTLTSKQEEQLRIDLIRKYGITNDDIIITKNADGSTAIQINSLTPYEVTDENGNITYEVSVEFFASLNENASISGDYTVDTEDSGVMLGEDAKGYEATFDTSTITLTSQKTRVIFTINGEVYEISESLSNGYAVAPEFNVADDWQFSGWNTSANKAQNGSTFNATLVKANRTVTWHTASGDIVQTYVEGDYITPPAADDKSEEEIFLSWNRSIPTTMPDENLEFTAVYGGHVHKYVSDITKKMTCTDDGIMTYTCSCGDTYTEDIKATGHNYEAITPSLDKKDAKCTFCCTNCGDKYDYALDYAVINSSGRKYNLLYEFQLTDDDLNTEMQPDGEINVRIPLTDLHSNATRVTVIRTNPDGSKTIVPAKIENGFLIITCDHFTPYEVVFDVPCDSHVCGEWIVTKKATCTEEGSKHAYCTECEKDVFHESIDKLSHTESKWIIDKAATCSSVGKKHTECTVCHATIQTSEIAKLPHNYSTVTVEPTCTEEGYVQHVCSCGDSYKDSYVSATGHSDTNGDGACDSCGKNLSASNCDCMCHSSGFTGFIWKILRFFYKLFGSNKVCDCGSLHY